MSEIVYDLGRVRPVSRGAWSGSAAYEALDWVTDGESSYMCLSDAEAGTPLSDTAHWSLLAKGQTGDLPDLTGGDGVTVSYDSSSDTYSFSLSDDVKTLGAGEGAADFAASANRLTFLSKEAAGISGGQSGTFYAVQYAHDGAKFCIAYGTEYHEMFIRHFTGGAWSAWKGIKLDDGGNSASADVAAKLGTARTISLAGDVSGSAAFDGSQDVTIQVELAELDTARVTTGVFDADRIPANAVLTLGTLSYDGKTALAVPNATQSEAGLMSADDKTALDTSVTRLSGLDGSVDGLDSRLETAEGDIDALETRAGTLDGLLSGGEAGQIVVSDGASGWHWAWLSDIYMQK